ncbi:hypothetical protein H7I94_26855 [Mycobacterium szulgai]|nr:hypothetical protein [Mycobacterium szulgai]
MAKTSRWRNADQSAQGSTPIGCSTTNSVLANAISDGGSATFQIRGILGFILENKTHPSDIRNLLLLIVLPSTIIGWAPLSNAGKL